MTCSGQEGAGWSRVLAGLGELLCRTFLFSSDAVQGLQEYSHLRIDCWRDHGTWKDIALCFATCLYAFSQSMQQPPKIKARSPHLASLSTQGDDLYSRPN